MKILRLEDNDLDQALTKPCYFKYYLLPDAKYILEENEIGYSTILIT